MSYATIRLTKELAKRITDSHLNVLRHRYIQTQTVITDNSKEAQELFKKIKNKL
ncbi:hypothetical protein HYO65_gp061 [Tenacibaculum phage PTm1]|uniref:Uncharacterized protein n=2 Tax=Shirahamavirus PTm1 TaxID=2846435 RepID=A0A5S9HXA9_9CAUD|nr:hypothetical protein HYO65_gp061 [Tenacibaculum phage PTm1]BBI90453.1 hypothetical protein [Tenacibaculum phage PTm1]BBI90761.1 hypothetical protein [Tenacibaculum phage PTm5]